MHVQTHTNTRTHMHACARTRIHTCTHTPAVTMVKIWKNHASWFAGTATVFTSNPNSVINSDPLRKCSPRYIQGGGLKWREKCHPRRTSEISAYGHSFIHHAYTKCLAMCQRLSSRRWAKTTRFLPPWNLRSTATLGKRQPTGQIQPAPTPLQLWAKKKFTFLKGWKKSKGTCYLVTGEN